MSRKKNRSSKKNGIITTVLTVLLIVAILGGAAAMLRTNDTKQETVEYKTIYFIPSDAWAEDGSLYGAWCWSDTGLPGSKFVLASDEDKDGIFELKINKAYTGVNFVDLKPNTDNLGLNWANKREQSDNVDLPTDNKVYYHQYANEWTSSSEKPWEVTTEEKMVYLNCADWNCTVNPVVYYFDKTGKNEPNFGHMTQCGAHDYTYTIPAGYTHVIFIEYYSEEAVGTWDNLINQTEDLIIPIGDANHFYTDTNKWTTPVSV